MWGLHDCGEFLHLAYGYLTREDGWAVVEFFRREPWWCAFGVIEDGLFPLDFARARELWRLVFADEQSAPEPLTCGSCCCDILASIKAQAAAGKKSRPPRAKRKKKT